MTQLDDRRKQILYRASYRGFKEADILFGNFAKAHLAELSDEELDEFEALLALPDHDVYGWVMGTLEPPANMTGPVMQRLKAFYIAAITKPK